ncbi:MAG: GGDEF domain-containing protein [Erysipelotrichaceae bacterium]
MFYRALYEENQRYLLDALREHHLSSTLYFDRSNYALVVYHLTNLAKEKHHFSKPFNAITCLSIAQALAANRNHYEAISAFLECLNMPYFRENLRLRFAIYLHLLDISIQKEDFFFIELYMNKLRKYQFAIDDSIADQLFFDYLCLKIEVLNNPLLNSSQLASLNRMMKTVEQQVTPAGIEIGMYLETFLADYLFASGDVEDALQHYSQALGYAMTLKDFAELSKLYLSLSQCYNKLNNNRLSLDTYKKYYSAKQLSTRTYQLYITDYMMESLHIPRELESTIMDVKHKAAHLDDTAILDRLTNVYTVSWFHTRMAKRRLAPDSKQHDAAILFIDLDWFHKYNDHYGHIKGDQVLAEIGFTLRNSIDLSHNDLARVGGEEFAIILYDMMKEDAIITAKQILANIRKLDIEHRVNKSINILTVSIGVAYGSADQLEVLLDQATQANKMAKKSGKNRVVCFHEAGGECK